MLGQRKLRVKVKSLAEESKIIRREAAKIKVRHHEDGNPMIDDLVEKNGLLEHRVNDVRKEARDAQLAYALLRGRTYGEVEEKYYEQPRWENILRIAKKFGGNNSEIDRNFSAFYCEGRTRQISKESAAS